MRTIDRRLAPSLVIGASNDVLRELRVRHLPRDSPEVQRELRGKIGPTVLNRCRGDQQNPGLPADVGESGTYRWTRDYLGPAASAESIATSLRDADDLLVTRPVDVAAAIVDLLVAGKVVGLFQGRSEFGPRALGHRSILADPRSAAMRDFVNAKVKKREWFRPLAPIVLLEEASRYFDIRRPSPFMQFAAPVRPEMAAVIPAVTHVDCTARLQTVGPEDDPLLRAVLARFAAQTGVPVLLNTSYNGQDEPIVETPVEALATFRATPMHVLAMPPYVVRKRSEPQPAGSGVR